MKEPAGAWHDLPMLRRALIAALLVGSVAVGCSDSRRPAAQFFALTDRADSNADSYASVLLRVDPSTLQPLGGGGLALGDAVTSRALSPDRRTLALGGSSFGELLFLDLSQPTRVSRLTLLSRYARDVAGEIVVEGWPRRSRLVAVATQTGTWWGPHPSQLIIVDPQRRRVIRRTPLHGTVISSVSLGDGTIALLVVGARFPTLMVVRPSGSTWSKPLSRLDLRGGDGVRLAGTFYKPTRDPALASDGRDRVFVVVSDRPIAEIRPHTHELEYHAVPLPHRYLSHPPANRPGSGGVNLRFSLSAVWLGDEQLAIGGFDELPGWIRGYGAGHRFSERALQIVNTHSWRHSKTIHATACYRVSGLRLCRATTDGWPPDGKGSRGASLLAYDSNWRGLYEKRSPYLWWGIAGGRLLAGSADGSRMSLLDPATGRLIRELRPSPLANDMWPFRLLIWKPSR
jgi:hypothetical protein